MQAVLRTVGRHRDVHGWLIRWNDSDKRNAVLTPVVAPRAGMVSPPPVKIGTPVIPSRSTAAISSEPPISIVWRKEMIAVVEKYTR